jgi:xanthine dehydrogenase molybdopterin-binding subunit B
MPRTSTGALVHIYTDDTLLISHGGKWSGPTRRLPSRRQQFGL